jgi:hypothetical protein
MVSRRFEFFPSKKILFRKTFSRFNHFQDLGYETLFIFKGLKGMDVSIKEVGRHSHGRPGRNIDTSSPGDSVIKFRPLRVSRGGRGLKLEVLEKFSWSIFFQLDSSIIPGKEDAKNLCAPLGAEE